MTQFFSHYPFFPLPPEALFNIAGADTEDGATGCMVFQMPPPGHIDFDMPTREAGWHGDYEGVARELANTYAAKSGQGGADWLLTWFSRSKELLNLPTMPEGATDVDAETRELGPQQG